MVKIEIVCVKHMTRPPFLTCRPSFQGVSMGNWSKPTPMTGRVDMLVGGRVIGMFPVTFHIDAFWDWNSQNWFWAMNLVAFVSLQKGVKEALLPASWRSPLNSHIWKSCFTSEKVLPAEWHGAPWKWIEILHIHPSKSGFPIMWVTRYVIGTTHDWGWFIEPIWLVKLGVVYDSGLPTTYPMSSSWQNLWALESFAQIRSSRGDASGGSGLCCLLHWNSHRWCGLAGWAERRWHEQFQKPWGN